MTAKAYLAAILAIIIVCLPSFAAPGNVDTRFDVGGPPPGLTDTIPLGNGTVFANGELLTNGVRDLSFSSTNFLRQRLEAYENGLLEFDTTLRYFTNVRNPEPTWIVDFGGGRIERVRIAPDRKIYVAGQFATVNGVQRPTLARLLPDGTLDSSYSPVSIGTVTLNDMALTADGQLLLAGGRQLFVNGFFRPIIRLRSDGTFDRDFDPAPQFSAREGETVEFDSILPQPDGKILIGGNFRFAAGRAQANLARVDSSGALDLSFNPNHYQALFSRRIRIHNGNIYFGLKKISFSGVVDPSFPEVDFPFLERLEIGADGAFYATGTDLVSGVTLYHNHARLFPSGLVDQNFDRRGPTYRYKHLAVDADGKILAVGEGGMFRFNFNGSLDRTFTQPDLTGISAVGAGYGKIFAAGNTWPFGLRLVRLASNGSIDPQFPILSVGEPNLERRLHAIAPLPDGGCIVSGAFTAIGGTPVTNVAKIFPNGSVDLAFRDNAGILRGGEYYTLVRLPNGQLYTGGTVGRSYGPKFDSLARLNPDGTFDETFRTETGGFWRYPSSADGRVLSVASQTDGSIIVGGIFRGYGADGNRYGLAKLLSNGNRDTTFNPTVQFGGAVSAVVTQPDGKIVVAHMIGVHRLHADGSTDMTFQNPGVSPYSYWPDPRFSDEPVRITQAMVMDDWGDLTIAGSITNVYGLAFDGIARLHGAALETPLQFGSPSVAAGRITLPVTGPRNYSATLMQSNGNGWTAGPVLQLLNGSAIFESQISGQSMIFTLRASRP